MQSIEQEYQVLLSQRSVFASELENLASLLAVLSGAAVSLEEMKNSAWVSLGAQAGFILAKEISDEVLVPVGFRFYLKMPKASAKEKIEKRVNQVRKAIAKLNEEVEKIERRMLEMRKEALKARKGDV
ncbi:MAG: hypothetical protein QW035_02175 [Candidatus Anstonellales archaeon]